MTVADMSDLPAVVIADDEPALRRLIRAALSTVSCRVLEAADGQEAWQLIRYHHPALVVLDWQMPNYTGVELAATIKGDPQLRDTYVLLLTARATAHDRLAAAEAQVDRFLAKPFSPAALAEIVEQHLAAS